MSCDNGYSKYCWLQTLFFLNFHYFIFKFGASGLGELQLRFHLSNFSLNFGSGRFDGSKRSFLLVLKISFVLVRSQAHLSRHGQHWVDLLCWVLENNFVIEL